jgi:hypothetical protein
MLMMMLIWTCVDLEARALAEVGEDELVYRCIHFDGQWDIRLDWRISLLSRVSRALFDSPGAVDAEMLTLRHKGRAWHSTAF